ncbi:MAG TPA: DUF4652 domain-containing protein [Pseudobacteroides sp.]|nr:DUF4652 domain-containing protein [Pseudobacteroides sp.]
MKRLLVLAIALIISFSGCYDNKGETKESPDIQVEQPSLSTKVPSGIPEEDNESNVLDFDSNTYNKLYELPNDKQIYYSEYKSILFKSGEKLTLLNDINKDEFASSPVLSPDKKNIAYISPYEFELNGNVYIFDTDNETAKKAIQVDIKKEDSAKVVKWLDNDRLLVIIGYGKGTVSRGGNLYLYNIKTNELKAVKEVSEMEEIVDVNVGTEGTIIDIITWNEEHTEFKTKQVPIVFE